MKIAESVKPNKPFIFVTRHWIKAPETKIAEFLNSIDSVEAAHNERLHLDVHCLSFSL